MKTDSGAFNQLFIDIPVFILCVIPALIIISLSALLIKLTSKAPVFYVQRRVGFKGRSIKVFKLRTMVNNKITPVGKLLRITGIDELPQLWLIFKGDMSFFGPRPRPRKELTQEYLQKILLKTKPGLLSICSVIMGPGRGKEENKNWDYLKFDEYEMKNWSIILMLKMIISAIMAVSRFNTVLDRFHLFGLSPKRFYKGKRKRY